MLRLRSAETVKPVADLCGERDTTSVQRRAQRRFTSQVIEVTKIVCVPLNHSGEPWEARTCATAKLLKVSLMGGFKRCRTFAKRGRAPARHFQRT
jgi:hypothetical protein